MADPTWENVVLRLTCDGADASTTFTDLSPAAHTVTAVGGAEVDTAESKWGGGSLRLTGASYLSVASSSQFKFDDEPWTIALWVKAYDGLGGSQMWRMLGGTDLSYGWSSEFEGRLSYVWNNGYGEDYGTEIVTYDAWHHVAWSYDGTTIRAFLNGVVSLAVARAINHPAARALRIGEGIEGWIDDVVIVKGEAVYTSAFTPPTGPYPTSGDVSGQEAYLEAPGILDTTADVQVLARLLPIGWLSDTGPLGQPSVLARTDFTAAVDTTKPVRYVVDLHTEDGDVRAPVSSWQATQQVDASCYLQCVIPSCDPYVDAISEAASFTVSRTGTLLDGSPVEYPMATSEINDATFTRSPSRNTATLSGYSDAFATVEDPESLYDRTLRDARLITTSSGGTRVRCAIDWLLRPSQRAYVGESPFVVAYINWYANQDDEFMDVGSRNDTGG